MLYPGLIKRLTVVVYDGLLLCGAILFTSLVLMAIFNAVAPASFYVQPLSDESLTALEHSPLGRQVGGAILSVNALIVSFLFYGWFWTHGGQTLGMRAWNLFLVSADDGKFINWSLALKRYLLAIVSWVVCGLGFAWILTNNKRQTWHDLGTNTIVVVHKKKKADAAK